MNKKLDWFKFSATDWLSGSVQLLSDGEKGTFIDLIAMIWKEQGSVNVDKVLYRKLRIDNATACDRIDSYCELGILVMRDNKLSIKFLDNQIEDIQTTSKKNSENAKKRWDKKKNECDRMPIREDKIREEEKRTDNKKNNNQPAKPVDEKYLKFCEHYYNKLIEASAAGHIGTIKSSTKWDSKAWTDNIRLLETSDGIEWGKITELASWYFTVNIKSGYQFQAFSMKSLREKFSSMETHMLRDTNQQPQQQELSLEDRVNNRS